MTKKYILAWLSVMLVLSIGCQRSKYTDLEIGKIKLMGENRPTEAVEYLERSIEKEQATRNEAQVYLVFAYRRAMSANVAKLTNAVETYSGREKQLVATLKQDVPETSEQLIRVLAEQNRLQQDAALLLTELGAPAVPKIVDTLHRYAKLQPICIDILESIGAQALDGLVVAASNTSLSPVVRARVIQAIDRIGDPKAMGTLKDIREKDPEKSVQMEATVALYKMGEKQYEGEILAALDSDDGVVRRIAARTVDVLNSFPLQPVLKSLNDPDSEVRLSLVESLNDRPDPSAKEPLLQILLNDPDERVKNSARTALANYGEDLAPRLVKELPSQEDWKVRHRIVLLLEEPKVIGGINADLAYELDRYYRTKETHQTVKDELVKLLKNPVLPK